MNQGPRDDCLIKKTEGRKSRDTVPLMYGEIKNMLKISVQSENIYCKCRKLFMLLIKPRTCLVVDTRSGNYKKKLLGKWISQSYAVNLLVLNLALASDCCQILTLGIAQPGMSDAYVKFSNSRVEKELQCTIKSSTRQCVKFSGKKIILLSWHNDNGIMTKW
jgi:hypothetical protein